MRFKVRQTLTFSKEIEADSKEEAEKFWSEKDADTQYGKLQIREIGKIQQKTEKIIHASGLSGDSETDCGLYITNKIIALDARLLGNMNRVTCKRCIQITYKNY